MVEAEADEVTEDVILEAIMFGHQEVARLVEFQEEIIRAVGVEKADMPVTVIDQDILTRVEEVAKEKLETAIKVTEKHAREEAISEVKATTLDRKSVV